MNPSVIKEFLVALGFQIDESGFKKFTASVDDATKKTAVFGAAVAATAATVFYGIARVAESYKDLAVSSQLLHVSAQGLEMVKYAADATGSSAAAAESSIANLSQTINNTMMRVGNGAYMFHALGVQIKDANGHIRDTADVLFDIGDAIKKFDQSKQLVILQNLGIDPTLLRTLTTDTGNLRSEFRAMYKEVGLDSGQAAEQGMKFHISLFKLKFTLESIYKSMAVKFIPTLVDGMDRLRRMVISQTPNIMNGLTPLINLILRFGEGMLTLGIRMIALFGKLNEKTNGWAGYILAAAVAWRILNLSFLASPIGIIIALGLAIAGLVDDYMTWKEGGQSLIDWSKWEPGIKAATKAVKALGEIIMGAAKSVVFLGKSLWDLVNGNFSSAWKDYKDFTESFYNEFGKGIYDLGSSAVDALDAHGRYLAGVPAAVSSTARVSASSGAVFKGGPDMSMWKDAPKGILLPPPSGGGSVNIHQQTNIKVEGSADPSSTARHVAAQQSNVNADIARNMRSAVR